MDSKLKAGSRESRLEVEKKAAKEFVRRNVLSRTKIEIVTFDNVPRPVVDFTNNSYKLERAIDSITASGETKTQKALMTAGDKLLGYKMRNGLYINENDGYRKVLVLLTDGFPSAAFEMKDFAPNDGEIRDTPYGKAPDKYAISFTNKEFRDHTELLKNS